MNLFDVGTDVRVGKTLPKHLQAVSVSIAFVVEKDTVLVEVKYPVMKKLVVEQILVVTLIVMTGLVSAVFQARKVACSWLIVMSMTITVLAGKKYRIFSLK